MKVSLVVSTCMSDVCGDDDDDDDDGGGGGIHDEDGALRNKISDAFDEL